MSVTLANGGIHSGRRASFTTIVSRAFSAWRTRRALQTLDANARRDLGLLESQIALESARPIWDVPQNW